MANQPAVKVVYIKKKAKGHGHHGGAWKVAYADFVTAMMALFIVLWLLTQTDQQSKERISEYFRTGTLPGGSLVLGDPGGSNPPVPIDVFEAIPSTRPPEERKLDELTKQIEEILKEAQVDPELKELSKLASVRAVPEGVLIELVDGGENFMFAVASSDLKPGAVAMLQKLGPLLSKLSNKIEIHGHTDARPFDKGDKKTNWQLSFERADEARAVLESTGVEKGKIVGVYAHADTKLHNRKDPYAAENRRLSILVVRSNYGRITQDKGKGATDAKAAPPEGEDVEHGQAPEEGTDAEHAGEQAAEPDEAHPDEAHPDEAHPKEH